MLHNTAGLECQGFCDEKPMDFFQLLEIFHTCSWEQCGLFDTKSSLICAEGNTLFLFPSQTHLGCGIWEKQRYDPGFPIGMCAK